MSLQVEVAEAVCSALYQLAPDVFFPEFLGEADGVEDTNGERGHAAWFHIGRPPKDMRVTVFTPEKREAVTVKIEWRNHFADARNPLKGEQVLTIGTYARSQSDLMPDVEQAVVRVMEVYRDVLGETGVAGKISDLVESRDDSADPEE